jgi:TonB family protein
MRAILIVGFAVVAGWAGLEAQDPLSVAKDLYASAAYEDALTALSRIDGGSTAPEIGRQADQYRAFCLYALGRTREAELVAESMIRKEPLVRLDAADASPRLESLFSDVRKRLLPSLIRERFRTARSAIDRKSFGDAEPALNQARLMITEAETLGVKDDGLGDLSVLVDGFLQLIRSSSTAERQAPARTDAAAGSAAVTSPTVVRPPGPSAPAETPARSGSTSPPPAATASRSAASSPATAARGPRIYSLDDEDVSPPVVIDQRMPGLPMEMTLMIKALHITGVVDVVIDETGAVVDATIRRSVNVGFDSAILRSARNWKYRPAMKDGVPVRYVKTLALVP